MIDNVILIFLTFKYFSISNQELENGFRERELNGWMKIKNKMGIDYYIIIF